MSPPVRARQMVSIPEIGRRKDVFILGKTGMRGSLRTSVLYKIKPPESMGSSKKVKTLFAFTSFL